VAREKDIPTQWLDALADPGAAPAASTAAGLTTAMAAALLFMALERTKPPPFGSVAQARALRRRTDARVTQTMIAYERARTALLDPASAGSTLPIEATVPVLEGICEDAADVIALAEEVIAAVDHDSQADVAAAAHLAAGAARAIETLIVANRLHPEVPGGVAQLTARAAQLTAMLSSRPSS
jgi:hypothetical protein